MQKSPLPSLITIPLLLLIITDSTNAFNITVAKPDGGTYYRFWFVYGCFSIGTTVILIVFTSISMCRRYKLVASQDEEISEIQ
ncbi:hypothetical protein L3Y34_013941 [Caenorhabditis briggsae]|uniref:Uncharacterized protein n=1 Tax=Caenorhabditis briggsae TaxID=6238 RepID=A0AAE9IXG8_CAEBR|nr:hypothetical protein L3Y34_013941 [Caenorhabditis briggsae]